MRKHRLPKSFRYDFFLLLVYLLLSAVLLAFSSGGFVINFKNIGFSLFSGVQRGVYSVSSFTTGTISAITELAELKHKYQVLTEKLQDYELLQRLNADIREENQFLKEQLGFSETLGIANIPAEIIGRDPNNLYSGIVINRGAKHGIRKHMPVVSFQGSNTGLVGKIVQVGRNTSLIMPVFDYQSYISTRLDITRYEGLTQGQGSSDQPLLMKYVKKRAKDEIKIGDLIVTSGENNTYPKNIPIGFVVKTTGLDYETSLTLEIEPIIDFTRLENVFVLNISQIDGEAD